MRAAEIVGPAQATQQAGQLQHVGGHQDQRGGDPQDWPRHRAGQEYRRAQAWNTYIGWLTCPVENYGWEINVGNHIRLLTAYRDLDSGCAIEDIR